MDLEKHSVLLATGIQAPLLGVTGALFLLDRLLASTPDNRKLVGQLRQACLTAQPVSPELAATFAYYGFGDADGTIDPVVQQVVLAAVRGEDIDLHIVSPYVNAWDRALSDLVISREKIRGKLPTEQAETLIAGSLGLSTSSDTPLPKPGESWLSYVLKKHQGPGFPPPSAN